MENVDIIFFPPLRMFFEGDFDKALMEGWDFYKDRVSGEEVEKRSKDLFYKLKVPWQLEGEGPDTGPWMGWELDHLFRVKKVEEGGFAANNEVAENDRVLLVQGQPIMRVAPLTWETRPLAIVMVRLSATPRLEVRPDWAVPGTSFVSDKEVEAAAKERRRAGREEAKKRKEAEKLEKRIAREKRRDAGESDVSETTAEEEEATESVASGSSAAGEAVAGKKGRRLGRELAYPHRFFSGYSQTSVACRMLAQSMPQ